MPRAFTPKVVTANDLLEGDVIYMTGDGNWTRAMATAELFSDEAAATAALARATTQPGVAVGPYLADATKEADAPAPTHFREDFRRRGPSNYAHGKQVELENV